MLGVIKKLGLQELPAVTAIGARELSVPESPVKFFHGPAMLEAQPVEPEGLLVRRELIVLT